MVLNNLLVLIKLNFDNNKIKYKINEVKILNLKEFKPISLQ